MQFPALDAVEPSFQRGAALRDLAPCPALVAALLPLCGLGGLIESIAPGTGPTRRATCYVARPVSCPGRNA